MALRSKHGPYPDNLDLLFFGITSKFTDPGEFFINSALNYVIHDFHVYFAMEIRTPRRVTFDFKACQEQNEAWR